MRGQFHHAFEVRLVVDAAEVDAPLVLCGRNAVQLPPPPSRPDVERLVARLEQAGVRDLRRTPLLLRFEVDEFAVTVFNDVLVGMTVSALVLFAWTFGRVVVPGRGGPVLAVLLARRMPMPGCYWGQTCCNSIPLWP